MLLYMYYVNGYALLTAKHTRRTREVFIVVFFLFMLFVLRFYLITTHSLWF